jgi:hypothetical protein
VRAIHLPVNELAPNELASELGAARQMEADARTFGMVGIGVGALGLVVAVLARRAGPARESTPRLASDAWEG